MWLVKGHKAGKRQSWDSDPSLLRPNGSFCPTSPGVCGLGGAAPPTAGLKKCSCICHRCGSFDPMIVTPRLASRVTGLCKSVSVCVCAGGLGEWFRCQEGNICLIF